MIDIVIAENKITEELKKKGSVMGNSDIPASMYCALNFLMWLD